MSDRIRNAVGIALVLISVFLCAVNFIGCVKESHISFRSGNRADWGIKRITAYDGGNVQINLADFDELTELPGIGETLSLLIISERSENGPFYYAEDLEAVKGIGSAKMEKIRNLIDLTQDESGD